MNLLQMSTIAECRIKELKLLKTKDKAEQKKIKELIKYNEHVLELILKLILD